MTAPTSVVLPVPGAAPPPPRLVGDLAIWLVILMELATFGLMFVGFAWARRSHPEVFAQGQAQLHLTAGTINTLLLVGGSWCVARALQALRHQHMAAGRVWLVAALATALAFLVLKSLEFRERFAQGIDLDTNVFWTLFLLLTGFHFLHVLVAAVLLALVLWHAGAARPGAFNLHGAETAGVFWHMVDLLWLVLFPLVYVMR